MTDITELVKLRDTIEYLEDRIKTDNTNLHRTRVKLQSECPHSNYIKTEQYSRGGYEHLSSNTIIHTCAFCKKILKNFADPNYKGSYS